VNWLLKVLEEVIPSAAILLSAISVAVAWVTLRRTSAQISDVREKLERVRNSPVVEDHAELPGFSQQPEADDVDDRP
jgi:hypothetical protein